MKIFSRLNGKYGMAAVVVLFAIVGIIFLLQSSAATDTKTAEAEDGRLTGGASMVSDNSASQGKAVRFSPTPTPPPTPPTPPGGGGGNTVAVSTAAQLTSAMANAKPGDIIQMADGTYSGKFNSTKSGSASAPITLRGSNKAIIDGGSLGSGYTLSLGTKNSGSSVSYWRYVGFTVTGGQKGIMWDNVQNSIIDGVTVQNIGHEGIHLRNFSNNNTVQNSTVTKTGRDDQRYGEGLYIGTAQSNWDTFSQGKPDRSNNNKLLNNTISYTGAESIDVKEATHDGVIEGNNLDGIGMCFDTGADCNFADSLLDMKGEGWRIENNTGKRMRITWKSGNQENDAFQVHTISQGASEGSGNNNVFQGNKLSDVAGYGFNIQSKATGTIIDCTNTVTNAGKGFGNVACK